MSTELAIAGAQQTAMQRMGSKEDLAELADRFLMFYNVPQKDLESATTRAAGLKAAQLTIRFGFTPGVHVYMVKRGGAWAAEESLEAWKEAANKHSRLEKFLYDVQTRPMSPDEVKANTPPSSRYTPEDCGFWARVVRFDIARQYQQLGMQYDPQWVPGFWRKEAYEQKVWNEAQRKMVGTGKWESDTIPNQRTPSDVARRRAMRAALRENFSLISLDDYTTEQRIAAAMLHMQREMAPDLPDSLGLFVEKPVQYEDDGDVVWATPDKRKPSAAKVAPDEVEATYTVQVAPAPAPQPKANGNGAKAAPAPDLDTARKAFHAQGVSVFGKDWDNARHWLIGRYTRKMTPDNFRESATELTAQELQTLRMTLVDRGDFYLDAYGKEFATRHADALAAGDEGLNGEENPFGVPEAVAA